MKEDILEQISEDYLQSKGYFTKKNTKFRPHLSHPDFNTKKDSSHSDIDVIGFNPNIQGTDRVWVISCKSWQGGFDPRAIIAGIERNKIRSGRETWKAFRELVSPKWSHAFLLEVKRLTGADEFTYVTVVTRLIGQRATWESYTRFIQSLNGNPIKLLTFREMIAEILPNLKTTLAASDLGRTMQLLKVADCFNRSLLN
jgi:hypothetical protein